MASGFRPFRWPWFPLCFDWPCSFSLGETAPGCDEVETLQPRNRPRNPETPKSSLITSSGSPSVAIRRCCSLGRCVELVPHSPRLCPGSAPPLWLCRCHARASPSISVFAPALTSGFVVPPHHQALASDFILRQWRSHCAARLVRPDLRRVGSVVRAVGGFVVPPLHRLPSLPCLQASPGPPQLVWLQVMVGCAGCGSRGSGIPVWVYFSYPLINQYLIYFKSFYRIN